MGLISSAGENLLDFLELRHVLSTYEGASGIRSGGLSKGQSTWELLGGLSGFLSHRCWGLRPCVDSVPEPEESSPVQTWILRVLLDSPQGSQYSSRVGACTCAFLPSCSSSVTLLFPWVKGSVPFPRGFPTGVSHVPPWCVSISILGLKVDAVQGKQVSLEWTETSGGLWECGTTLEILSPFLWRAPPLEMRR